MSKATDLLMNLACGGTDCDGCCRKKNCPIDLALNQLKEMVLRMRKLDCGPRTKAHNDACEAIANELFGVK